VQDVADVQPVFVQLAEAYGKGSTPLMQAVDTISLGTLAMAAVLLLYIVVFGTFPFNSALAGIASCLGFSILTSKCLT
jgi:hypothetical protein